MKVCMIVDDYLPHSTKVAAKMMHELACEFVKNGHQVSVITPYDKIENKLKHNRMDSIDVYFFKSGKTKNTNKVQRAFNETLLSYRAWRALKDFFKTNRHDYIIYYSPTIFWGPLVAKLKNLWQVKSYLVLRDIFPQWAVDHGLIKENSLIERYFKYFEKINYDSADVIGLMSPKNLEWFNNHKNVNALTEVLYNWADKTSITPTGKYRKKYGLENKIIFFYGGNMGHAQDMMNIIRLAKRLQHRKDVHFLLIGSGDEVELIKNEIKQDNIKNILLLPPVSQEEFKYLLADCDVGLFTLNKHHKTHNFPGKILSYLSQSLPILGSVNKGNDLIEIIDGKAGLISINGEDEKFYQNALKLLNQKYREKLGKRGKNLLDTLFSTNAAYKTITSHFTEI